LGGLLIFTAVESHYPNQSSNNDVCTISQPV
jgi:hypothetical protein